MQRSNKSRAGHIPDATERISKAGTDLVETHSNEKLGVLKTQLDRPSRCTC